MKTLLILTGWTRGLGAGMLRAYADIHGRDLAIIGIARGKSRGGDAQALADSIRSRVGWMQTLTADLARAAQVDRLIGELETSLQELAKGFGGPERSILLNNAATLGPIETLPGVENRQSFHEQAAAAFALNCIAPALLSGWFLSRLCAAARHQNLIINISSGASQGPMGGAAAYSMTKAALNVLSQSLVTEQGTASPAVKVLAISPGMVETSMQETLRAQPGERLPNVEYFREAARNGTARSPIEIGRIIASLNYDSLENGSYHHIRELAGGQVAP